MRCHRAGIGWLISAVLHALLLGALATSTVVESRAHPGVWIETRLDSSESPSPPFTLVESNEPTVNRSIAVAAHVAPLVSDHDLAIDANRIHYMVTPVGAMLSAFPDDPAELGLPVRQGIANDRSSTVADNQEAGRNLRQVQSGGSAGFFGLEARGKRFVYIVDASGSMRGDRFQRACAELMRSVSELSDDQGFYVFFFNSATFPLFFPATAQGPVPATAENKHRLMQWIGHAVADGSTYPKTALFTALAMQPDAIFVLSDGKFPERTVRRVTAENESGVVIHSIGFGGQAAEEVLKPLAEQNGGHYKFVP
jgi:hypothetical protein